MGGAGGHLGERWWTVWGCGTEEGGACFGRMLVGAPNGNAVWSVDVAGLGTRQASEPGIISTHLPFTERRKRNRCQEEVQNSALDLAAFVWPAWGSGTRPTQATGYESGEGRGELWAWR